MNIANKRIFHSFLQISYLRFNPNHVITNLPIINKQTPLYSFSSFIKNNHFYFSSFKNVQADQIQTNQSQSSVKQSNLPTYIKNQKTIQILQKKGIKSLFPIQIQTFQAVYQGRDLLASDRTGSGKTIAYSLPIIQKLRDNQTFKSGRKQVKFLIMCPTRQLTIQVFKQISSLRHNSNDFNIVAVYGGSSIDDQIRQLRNGVDIIVATPGRLMDLLERKCISFSQLEATCIDQADQMLQKGFKLDVQQIFKIIENQRRQKTQNLMFSATIPDWVDKLSNQYMDKSKKKINLISKSQTQTSTTVQHLAVECHSKDRINCIRSLIKMFNPKQEFSTIIFSQTKMQVNDIAMELGKDAAFLQGDMEQKQRQFNLNAFRNGKRKILIATDVASRGLDIQNVGLVIQLQPPRNTEPFIHRAGRTGRAGRKGICVTLFDKKKNLQGMIRIQNQAKITFKHIARPILQQTQEVWVKSLNKLPQKFKSINKNVLNNQKLSLMADVLLSTHSDVKQLIKKQLIEIVGQPPINHSLTTQEAGFKSFVIRMKEEDKKFNSLTILNYLKNNFQKIGITNVHVQSNDVIFDVSDENLSDFRKALSSQIVQESPYLINDAIYQDRQMPALREVGRGKSSYEDNRSFKRRDDNRNSSSRNQRNYQIDQSDNLTVFIPNLPFEIMQEDLQENMSQYGVEYKKIRLIKKSQSQVFAFVQTQNSKSFKTLLKSGIRFESQKFRVYIAEDKSSIEQTNARQNRNSSWRKPPSRDSQGRQRYENKMSRGNWKRQEQDY